MEQEFLDNCAELAKKPGTLAFFVAKYFNLTKNPDPFSLAKKLGIRIQLFQSSSNNYSFLTYKDDIPTIFLNNNLSIGRMRYNVSFQLYHYLIGKKDTAYYENYKLTPDFYNAKAFASHLLLPKHLLEKTMANYLDANGMIDFKDIPSIACILGVNLNTVAFRIFYEFNNILEVSNIKKLAKMVKESNHQVGPEVDSDKYYLKYVKQAVDVIDFSEENIDKIALKYVEDSTYNEILMNERIEVDPNKILTMIVNYRLNGSVVIPDEDILKDKIEKKGSSRQKRNLELLPSLVLGHLKACDYIYSEHNMLGPEYFENLHRLLFEDAQLYNFGHFRSEGYEVSSGPSCFFKATLSKHLINKIDKLTQRKDQLILNKDKMSTSKFIDESIKIFYDVYTSQLFEDGNSRTSKIFLNDLLHLKGIPSLFYIANNMKDEYLDAIKKMGKEQILRENQLNGAYYQKIIKDGKMYSITPFGYMIDKDGNTFEIEDDDVVIYEVSTEDGKIAYIPLKEINYQPLELIIYKQLIRDNSRVVGYDKYKLKISKKINIPKNIKK